MNLLKYQEKIRRVISSAKKMRLSKRAIALFAISVFLPIILIIYLYSQHAANIIQNELASNMQLAVNQIKNNLDYRFEQVSDSALSILSTAYPYIRSGNTGIDEQLKEYEELKLLVAAYEGKHMISKIRLYVPADKIYANQQDTFYSLPDISQLKTYERGVLWMETYGARIYEGSGFTNVISCRMTISSKTNYDEVASVLQLDIEETKLSKIFSAGISSDEEIYLVNKDGMILSHTDPGLIGKSGLSELELKTVLMKQTGHMSGKSSQNGDLVAFSKLDVMDWYLIMRLPASTVYGSDVFSFDIVRVLLILSVVAIFAIALILIYSGIIESTVKRINTAIIELNKDGNEPNGNITIQDYSNENSLALLEDNAKKLVETIKTLMEQSYEAQLKARDFHLKALQAQINPHFLYNTLDAIKWMILEGEIKDSVWMINAFSKYFRLSLSKGRDVVTLQEELDLIRAYLGIMQKRFSSIAAIEIHVDKELEECLIPKLTLQPLVENALNHGILHSGSSNGRLKIIAGKENERLIIIIKDNGNGMTPEQVQKITNYEQNNTKGYGLANVDERLKLFGGEDCGIVISSELKIGTTVTLSLPLKYMEQEVQLLN